MHLTDSFIVKIFSHFSVSGCVEYEINLKMQFSIIFLSEAYEEKKTHFLCLLATNSLLKKKLGHDNFVFEIQVQRNVFTCLRYHFSCLGK